MPLFEKNISNYLIKQNKNFDEIVNIAAKDIKIKLKQNDEIILKVNNNFKEISKDIDEIKNEINNINKNRTKNDSKEFQNNNKSKDNNNQQNENINNENYDCMKSKKIANS